VWVGAGHALNLHHGDVRPDRDDRSFGCEDLGEHPGDGCGHLGIDLVGIDLNHGVELEDAIPRVHQPA
jgi:hypothetical protein